MQLFVIYSLEYKSIIIEQMSEEREQQHLGLLSAEERARADDPADESEPYGVILNTVVIRDLSTS